MPDLSLDPRLNSLLLYTRQFSALIDAGVSLMRCFDLLAQTTADPELKAANARLSERVGAGAHLSQAMGEQPDLFPPFYIAFVRAGEIGGVLDDSFAYLSDWLEQERDAADRLRTRALLLRLSSKTLGGATDPEVQAQTAVDAARRAARIASFCRLFEMCLVANVPLHTALATAAQILGEEPAAHIRAGIEGLAAAQPIAPLLAEVNDLKPIVAPMVGTGEEHGSLDDMLRNAAEFYDAQAAYLLHSALPLPPEPPS